MILGNQTVSPVFFWSTMLIAGACLGYLTAMRIWNTGVSMSWKLQRITGGFLLTMIPAHLLFMHLNVSMGHQATVVIARMQGLFIKAIDVSLVIGILLHGGYGLLSITKDYLTSRLLQNCCALIILYLTQTHTIMTV